MRGIYEKYYMKVKYCGCASPVQTLQKLVHETYLQDIISGGNAGRAGLPI